MSNTYLGGDTMQHLRLRGFEVVSDDYRKFPNVEIITPSRSTENAMAYDFYSNEDYRLRPGEEHEFVTDIKAYMLPNEGFIISNRSGMGTKYEVTLKNVQGWIDMDFYGNVDNDGNISFFLKNKGHKDWVVKRGDRIGQGAFIPVLFADDDVLRPKKKRAGGCGSTGGY